MDHEFQEMFRVFSESCHDCLDPQGTVGLRRSAASSLWDLVYYLHFLSFLWLYSPKGCMNETFSSFRRRIREDLFQLLTAPDWWCPGFQRHWIWDGFEQWADQEHLGRILLVSWVGLGVRAELFLIGLWFAREYSRMREQPDMHCHDWTTEPTPYSWARIAKVCEHKPTWTKRRKGARQK